MSRNFLPIVLVLVPLAFGWASRCLAANPPTGLTIKSITCVNGTSVSVALTWVRPSGVSSADVDQYQIYNTPSGSAFPTPVEVPSASSGENVPGGTTVTATRTGLKVGVTYCFRIRAKVSGSWTGFSTVVCMPDVVQVQNVTASATSSSSVQVAWTGPSQTVDVIVVEKSTDNSNFSEAARVGSSVRSTVVGGLQAGLTYWFRVRVVDECRMGSPASSAPVTLTPPAPTGVTAVPVGLGVARVSWSNPAGATIAEVYASAGGSAPVKVGTTAPGASSLDVSGLEYGVDYTFTVRIQISGTWGQMSTASSPVRLPPPAPVTVTARATSSDSAEVSWGVPGGRLDSAQVLVSEDGGTPVVKATVAPGSSPVVVGGLAHGRPYAFNVRFVSGGLTGPAHPAPPTVVPPPPVPSGVSVTVLSGLRIQVSWTGPFDRIDVAEVRTLKGAAQVGTPWQGPASQGQVVISELAELTQYCFEVRFGYRGDWGAPAAPACASTPRVTPLPVVRLATNVVFGSEGDGQVSGLLVEKTAGPKGRARVRTVARSASLNVGGQSVAPAAGINSLGQGLFPVTTNEVVFYGDGAESALVPPITLRDDLVFSGPRYFDVEIIDDVGVTLAQPSVAHVVVNDDETRPPDPLGQVLPTPLPELTGALTVLFYEESGGSISDPYWRFPWEPDWRKTGTPAGTLELGVRTVELWAPPGFDPVGGSRTFDAGVSGPGSVAYGYLRKIQPKQGGGLRVVMLDEAGTAVSGAAWSLVTEPVGTRHRSGEVVGGLAVGPHLVQFSEVSGFVAPGMREVRVGSADGRVTTTFKAAYRSVRSLGTGQMLPVPDQNLSGDSPYAWASLLVTDAGRASGTLVRPRVGLTAAHAFFVPGTTNPVSTNAWWFFRQQGERFLPVPVAVQGWYVSSNYVRELARAGGNPNAPAVRNHDFAAVFFAQDVARGLNTNTPAHSGYRVAGDDPGQWIRSKANRWLVGYPVDEPRGKVAALSNDTGQFIPWRGDTPAVYMASDGLFVGRPGVSGAPLFTQQAGETARYPTAIYLGVDGNPGNALFRVIDADVESVIVRAELSSIDGQNHVGGGVPFPPTPIPGSPARLRVTLSEDSIKAGIGWRVVEHADAVWTNRSGVVEEPPDTYTLRFRSSNPDAPVPPDLEVEVVDGQETEVWVGDVRVKRPEAQADGRVRVAASGPPGRRMVLQAAETLAGNGWADVDGQDADGQGAASFSVPATGTVRFLRVVTR